MRENEVTSNWEARFDEAERDIANMDETDFLTLLMESRILQTP